MNTYNFSRSGVDALQVRVHPDHYGKSVTVIVDLARALEGKVCEAFDFQITDHGEPRVEVLAGQFCRGIISVEMTVRPATLWRKGYLLEESGSKADLKRAKTEIDKAAKKLLKAGFYEGSEQILG